MTKINQVILLVLDSVGIGNAPDAEKYGDEGSNTLGNIALALGGLNLPNLTKYGLGNIGDFEGISAISDPQGAFGRLTEFSSGKDTTTGHWELAGVSLSKPFPTFPKGFPSDFVEKFENRIGRKTLGNFPASGTVIIDELGEQHIETGNPIIYTSADSVFQIAAHEDIIPIHELYHICEIAREMLTGDLEVARVIARPFVGQKGSFKRTENRKDFSLTPPHETILDIVKSAGYMVAGVGKIEDIFANCGLTDSNHTGNNLSSINATIEFIKTHRSGLIFVNLIDFDQNYGHRNDPKGYARALVDFDMRLPDILDCMTPDDLLIITADHGNDPTTPSTDHSREQVPLLAIGKKVIPGAAIGVRTTFADVAETIAFLFNLEGTGEGKQFATLILKE